MSSAVLPAAILILGAILVPFIKGKAKSAYLAALPLLVFLVLTGLEKDTYLLGTLLGYEMSIRIDNLSLVFGYAFTLLTFIALIYSMHVRESTEQAIALVYAGSALGAVFAGDLITLFVFWEIMTITAGIIIWLGNEKTSTRAGFRYMQIHIFGGMCLLAGIIMQISQTGSAEFNFIGLDGPGTYLILLGFLVNAAAFPFHTWLTDAYPEASVTGTIFLSAYTTKTAVYVLARGFPGTEILVIVGIIMAVYPIFYAVLENDLRRVLSYSLVNQVGFMVVGIGIGTQLAINGAAAHAFAHIMYKGLLMMSAGAVLYRTGTAKCTELGGLYRTMPLTMIFCVIGAASISAFPLFSGFATKSMINSAAGYEHMLIIWLLLIFASAGVFHHAGIKVPYFAFFAHDSGKRPGEAPVNMRVAMGIAAFVCVFIGIFPGVFYNLLPYPVDYAPYTAGHVLSQLLLLCFASLAFTVLIRSGYYPPEQRAVNLDTDWIYRKAGPAIVSRAAVPVSKFNVWLGRIFLEDLPGFLIWFGKNPSAALKMMSDKVAYSFAGGDKKQELNEEIKTERERYPDYALKPWSIGSAVSSVLVFFLIYLILYNF